jgi:3-isopropylmalate dehydratase small subunit
MDPFATLSAPVAHLPEPDVDTDIIFPARFLLITEKIGLGRYAFFERRYRNGVERDDFPLRAGPAGPAGILVAGANFGCGSSREQAVWALADLGLRCIIATSFGEIFQSNCYKNGLLPIVLPAAAWSSLRASTRLTVDLRQCRIIDAEGGTIAFEIPAWRRDALLNGWDEVLTLLNTRADTITAFETSRRAAAPWLFARG